MSVLPYWPFTLPVGPMADPGVLDPARPTLRHRTEMTYRRFLHDGSEPVYEHDEQLELPLEW